MSNSLFSRDNLNEQLANHLSEQIVSGELAGGERIREQDWARRLSVGRGSIREALLTLERHHLVELSPGKGARVAPLDDRWLSEVYELWYLLFEAVARRAVGRLSSAEVDELAAGINNLKDVVNQSDPSAFFDAALALVGTLAELADHRLLAKQLQQLLPAARRCYRVVLWADQAESQRTLRLANALVAGARSGNQAAVVEAINQYATVQREALDRAIEQQRGG